MTEDQTLPVDRQKALQTISDMIEEIWGGLTLLIEDDGQNDHAHRAVLRSLLRIAEAGRGEAEIALGNATRA